MIMWPEPSRRAQLGRTVVISAGALSLALGTATLAGWAFSLNALLWFFNGIAAMQPMTALMFVACGFALLLPFRSTGAQTARIALGVAVLAASMLTLAEYAFDADFRFDTALFHYAVTHQLYPKPEPGRMALPVALAFALIATCLMLARSRERALRRVFVICATLLLLIITGILLRYSFGFDPRGSTFGFFYVAPLTAVGLTSLVAGILALRPSDGWMPLLIGDDIGPSAARRMLPPVVIVTVGVAWIANEGVKAGYYSPADRLMIITTVTLVLLAALTIWASSRLNRLDAIRRTEEALRDTRRNLEALLNNASVAIMTMDERNHCTYMNAAAEEMTGYTLAEMAGKTLHQAIHHTRPDGSSYPPEECPMAFPDESRKQGEECFVRPDGSFYRVAYTASPMVDEDGRPAGTILEVRNIEEEKALLDQLNRTQRLDAVGKLTGGIAHDFNNMLAIIFGNLDMLREQLKPGSTELELTDEALGAATRGAQLVKSLLAFARQQQLSPVAVDLNQRLPSITGMLKRTLGEAIEIRVKSDSDLWPARVDPTQVDHALVNLAINARDAMPDGGTLAIETANVHLDTDYAQRETEVTPGDYIMLAVSDSGTGMTAEVLAAAFEPFFTTKPEGKGTGLGLSQVYGWVKQSGGHIKIYSEVGHGTTIKIFLPRANGSDRTKDICQDIVGSRGGNERILVVEDDADLRRTVIRQLGELGYETIEAANGADALAIIKGGERYDLLLTDIVMPGGMNGLQLAEQARAIRPDIKIVFTSGYADMPGASREAMQEQLLSKPYRKQDLDRAIRKGLDAS